MSSRGRSPTRPSGWRAGGGDGEREGAAYGRGWDYGGRGNGRVALDCTERACTSVRGSGLARVSGPPGCCPLRAVCFVLNLVGILVA